jgi:hypothetical protein
MIFSELHATYWPELTPQEASAALNAFEVKVFDALPWLLKETETRQNAVIEYCLKLKNEKGAA